uniref:Synaptojanin-2-binding protein n=1 Tax=Anas platyrhynchos platyrhynchos TaxID=8840 RepID=A0A493TEQ0_ANAPP
MNGSVAAGGGLAEEVIRLTRRPSGLGFNIVGGTDQQYVSNDSSIYVSRIKKDGAAYLDGRLQEGDKIVINGRDLKDLRHMDAVELFRNAGYDVSLKIQRRLYLVGGSFGLREFAQIRYDVHKLHGTVLEMVFFTLHFILHRSKKKKTLTFWVYLNLLGIPRSAVFPQDTGYPAFKANLC